MDSLKQLQTIVDAMAESGGNATWREDDLFDVLNTAACEMHRMREALEFYADKSNYDRNGVLINDNGLSCTDLVHGDLSEQSPGAKARQCLEGLD